MEFTAAAKTEMPFPESLQANNLSSDRAGELDMSSQPSGEASWMLQSPTWASQSHVAQLATILNSLGICNSLLEGLGKLETLINTTKQTPWQNGLVRGTNKSNVLQTYQPKNR